MLDFFSSFDIDMVEPYSFEVAEQLRLNLSATKSDETKEDAIVLRACRSASIRREAHVFERPIDVQLRTYFVAQ